MNRIKLLMGAFLLALATQVVAQPAAKKILPYPIQQYKMKNGLNVVTVPYDSPGLAAFYIIMRVGSRDEVEAGKSGFAHFFEHMMFRGTEKYSKDQYSDALKSTGASANANTWLDRTVYHMTGNSAMLEKMFELEADRFQKLKYSVQDFKTEAGAVKGEYTKNSASPYVVLNEKVNDVAFTTHTYKHTTMGFFKDVVDMPNQYEYSLQFFQRFYKPEYATILVIGDVTQEQVNALSEKYFGMWERGNYVSQIPAEPAQEETRYVHLKKENFPPVLSLNYKGPAYKSDDMDPHAIDIFNSILFSEKSPLYKKLVIEEQKVREASASLSFTRDPYLIEMEASLVDAKDLQYVKDQVLLEVEKYKTTPVSADILAETKSRMKYGFAMGMNSPSRIAEAMSYFIWVTGDPEAINKAYAMYDKVSADDIMRVVKKYFVTKGLTVATISDADNSPVK